MATIPIRSRERKGGIIWDTPPNELPPNAWSGGVNVRFFRNRLERIGGVVQTFNVSNGRALWGIDRNGVRELLLVTATQVLISNDGNTFPLDVTPTVFSDQPDWIATQYGDWVILTSRGTTPLVLDPAGAQFVPFTNWPANYRAHKVTAYQNFLVAIGIEINGTPQNGLVKWSDAVDITALQDVEWTATTQNLSGENTLPGADGVILDFGPLRDTGIIYNANSVWRMDPSAAAPAGIPEVFKFRQIFADDGILQERCWVEVEGQHYVIGRHDLYRHNGHERVTIGDGRATEYFFSVLGSNENVFVQHFIEKQEVLFAFSRKGLTYANDALIYSYLYDAWTAMQIDTADSGPLGMFSHLARGPSQAGAVESWATITGNWEDYNNTSWADLFPSEFTLPLYGLAPEHPTAPGVYALDQSPDTATFTPTMVLERIDLDLDEYFEHTGNLKYWSRTIPLAGGSGTLTFEFGGRDQIAGSVQWGVQQPYVIGLDYKLDHRTTYRYPAMRVTQSDDGVAWLTGADLDVRPSHGR